MFAPLHCNFWNHKHLYHFTEKIATDRRIQLLQVQGPIFREIKTQLLFILFLKFNFLKPEKVRKEKLRGEEIFISGGNWWKALRQFPLVLMITVASNSEGKTPGTYESVRKLGKSIQNAPQFVISEIQTKLTASVAKPHSVTLVNSLLPFTLWIYFVSLRGSPDWLIIQSSIPVCFVVPSVECAVKQQTRDIYKLLGTCLNCQGERNVHLYFRNTLRGISDRGKQGAARGAAEETCY